MKLLTIIASLLMLFASLGCKNRAEPPHNETVVTEKEAEPMKPETPQEILAPTAGDIKSSHKFPDWTGRYSGVLPCRVGCEGYKHIIQIRKDSTYTLSLQELGNEDAPRVFKGRYHLDKPKKIITLDAEGDHLKFKVMEGMLKKLDKFGNEEKGAPPAKYLLQRVN